MSDNITHREVVFPAGWAKKCVEDAVGALSCPQCGSRNCESRYGDAETETGYASEATICLDCGEEF